MNSFKWLIRDQMERGAEGLPSQQFPGHGLIDDVELWRA